MDIRETSPDGRVVWVDFQSREEAGPLPPPKACPPGSLRTPPGNPDLDSEALARSLECLERAGGGA